MNDSGDRLGSTKVAKQIEQNLIVDFSDHFGHHAVDLNAQKILSWNPVNLRDVTIGLQDDSQGIAVSRDHQNPFEINLDLVEIDAEKVVLEREHFEFGLSEVLLGFVDVIRRG
jgi:hypothetical protein